MRAVSKFLLNDRNIEKSAFLWNALSAMLNSFQTTVLLIAITRGGNATHSSIFVMAYAIGNLMLNIGKYGVRQYQVTDVTEKYSYKEYLRARYISMGIMAIASIVYVMYNVICNGYSAEKAAVVLLICGVKAVEAFEDVLHGRMQQKGRLDVAGRILGCRLFVFIVEFFIVYVLSKDLVFTAAVSLAVTIIMAILLNGSVINVFREERVAEAGHVKSILWECFPLCVSICLNMYIANAPKYIIDTDVSDQVQTCFNIVFMPVFIIALLGNFIFQPYLNRFGLLWSQGKRAELRKMIWKLGIAVSVISVAVVVAGSFLGIPILQFIYGVDLKEYHKYLVIFMVDGGIIALQNLFIMVITTVRFQKYMIYDYIGIAVLLVLFGKKVLISYGLIGLCWFFTMALAVMSLLLLVLMLLGTDQNKKNSEKE